METMTRQQSYEEYLRAAGDRSDLLAMHALAPLSWSYLPWSVSAMRPSGIAAVLNEIVVNRRSHVVELGGGVSTFYIARLLSRRGGHLRTVEHDRHWADLMDRELNGEGLGDAVTVVRAPLTPTASGWPDEDAAWYEPGRLKDAVAGGPVDLLVVDGPPANHAGREHSRYPAAAFFAPMFAEDYAVILDDIDRTGEQEIMKSWERELGIAFERRLVNGSIGIGRPGPAFTA